MSTPDISLSINAVWLSCATYLIFFMQAGFMMLEAGFIKMKDYSHIVILVLMNICIDTLAWWITGYAFAYGDADNPILGTSYFFASGVPTSLYSQWLFEWAFSLDTTIVTGCICERMEYKGYALMCAVNGLWIYPIICHWGWGNGWLMNAGYVDFAGCGVVHLTGGIIGIVTAVFLGPRLNRWDPKYKEEFLPSNPTFIGLGTLILWFGWYGFNCGSTMKTTGLDLPTMSLVGMNTSLAGAAGGVTATAFTAWKKRGEYDAVNVPAICNGILAGTVAVTAPCNNIDNWAAVVIGIVAAFIYMFVTNMLTKYEIDDPVEAFPIHGGCGSFGLIAVGLFDKSTGLFYGGGFQSLGLQLLGIVSITAFAGTCTYIVMTLLKKLGWLRISKHEEMAGTDPYLDYKSVIRNSIEEREDVIASYRKISDKDR